MKVRANRRGFYGDLLRRVGDVFELGSVEHFSPRWMAVVDDCTPARRVSAQQAIDEEHARSSPFGTVRRVCEPVEDEGHVLSDADPFTWPTD